MKTVKHALSMVLLAIGSLLGFSARREECCNVASTVGTHANGVLPFIAEVTVGTRYLLVQKGAAADGIIINVANTRPIGVCLDEPTYDANKVTKAAVALLGCAEGTQKMVASKAIAAQSKIWTTAGGKVTDTYAAGAFFCGRNINAAAADGDIIEVAHCFPMLDASGTTL
jgi:hypothetical protein